MVSVPSARSSILVISTSSLISSPTDAVLSGGRMESTPKGGCRGTWLLGGADASGAGDWAPGGTDAGLTAATPEMLLPAPVSGKSCLSPYASSVPDQKA